MNVFQYANVTEQNWLINLADMGDFKPKFTFYSDFGIAEFCEVYMRDKNAVKKTFNNVMRYWSSDYHSLVEIILVLNHKSWSFDGRVDSSYLKCGESWRVQFKNLYVDLYQKADKKFWELYKGNESAVSYYYKVLD
jgi:hypothetical protein